MVHTIKIWFALLSCAFSQSLLIIKLEFNDSLLLAIFSLFQYIDWFCEKIFSITPVKF